MNLIFQAIADANFVRTVLLLLVTGALTGLLVPYVKARMDDQKLRDLKRFEADLARQSKVIESQVLLLERLAELLWGFHFLCLEVSYYGISANKKKYQAAREKYDRESWDYFLKIGTETGKALRLVSSDSYSKLKDFYDYWMIDTDNSIARLNAKPATEQEWTQHHHEIFEGGAERINTVLGQLARELRLEAPISG
jgi:hypothetical protein